MIPRAACGLLLCLSACGTLSVSDEQQLGDKFEREIRREYRFLNDDVVTAYVTKIGTDVLRTLGPQPFEYRFYVVENKEINAFAAPAGHIYVHTGTILRVRNVSELAGVLAHEIGHVTHRHIAQNYEKQRAASVGRQAAVIGAGILGGGAAAGAANLATGMGLSAVLNSFGREAERESDDFAVEALPAAGYDPSGLPSFFETLVAEDGPRPPPFLSSHPAPAERLQTTRAVIAAQDPPPGLKVDDNGRLEIIQRRIELLTEGTRPSRRR
jgi:predicted Zn-dependent protease